MVFAATAGSKFRRAGSSSPAALSRASRSRRARALAAQAGLEIETQRKRTSLATPMAIATAAGAVLALAILAMTVGLIRSESAGDLRTLTATGATRTDPSHADGGHSRRARAPGRASRRRRRVRGLAATYHDDLGYLRDVPIRYLVLIVVGVPLTATAAGWLLAGREPPAIARLGTAT